jgi:hypothetical protein
MSARKRRTGRVTNVDPWVVGGDGEFKDLVPLPPLVILGGRFIAFCIRKWKRTIIILLIPTLYFYYDSIILALLVPFLLVATYFTIYIGGRWYRSPDVPFIRRKP